MDLEQARSVKRELDSLFSTRVRGGGRRKFALGVATPVGATPYRVAVRAPSEEELPDDALEVIRARTAGELDVRFVGRITASSADPLSISRGVAIGASVSHYLCKPGTLGFFAHRTSDGVAGFVSNNHVLAAADAGQDGDEILHTAPSDPGKRPGNVIGHLVGGYPRLKKSNAVVDCAFARLVDGIAYDPASLGPERKIAVTNVSPEAAGDVCKVGRTTGLTAGRVTVFELDSLIDYPFGQIRFKEQIEIESAGESHFCRSGDSGSLVFTADGCHPVGLVFATSAIGGRSNCGLTYANPIAAVLTALGVTLIT